MKVLLRGGFVVMSLALLSGADKKDDRFSPGPAASYSSHQTNDKVTVAAVPYDTEDLTRTAFGKTNPNQHGILPVLVVIQNDTDQALKLDSIEVEYIGPDNRRVENTPASDVAYSAEGPRRPKMGSGAPTIPGLGKHKNPLSGWEIEGRAFAPRMLPAHEAANGFFYFQTRLLPGARFYLTGIRVASTGKDIFYFEIPIEPHH